MDLGIDILGIRFLVGDLRFLVPYQAEYSLPLVLLSYLFAFTGSFAGLTVSGQISAAQTKVEKLFWLVLGACALGGAVWSMHFIGMLAYQLPIEIKYATTLTIISLLPSIGASFVVLWLLSRNSLAGYVYIIGGVVTGAGIGLMHFIGMEAMRANASMGYDPVLFVLSIVVAVTLAIIALFAKDKASLYFKRYGKLAARLVAAAIMALAISGMHYTAMTSITFYEGMLCAKGGETLNGDSLYRIVFVAMFGFILLVLLAAKTQGNRAKANLLSAIIKNNMDGIIITNQQGIITLFSPAAERLFGYRSDEIIGQRFSNLIPNNKRKKYDYLLSKYGIKLYKKFIGRNREIDIQIKNGKIVPVEIGITEVQLGQEAIFSATVRDITQRRSMEQTEKQAVKELSNALDQQKKLNQVQREFVAMASHEFRTPLAIIDSCAQRIHRRKHKLMPEDVDKFSNRTREAVKRMIELVESTLSAERMNAGQLELELDECDPKQVILEICRRQEEMGSNISISTDLDMLPSKILADAGALDQIFTNLMSNAVKYTTSKPIVKIAARCEGADIIIEFSDNGIGIDSADLPRMFERFFRAKTSTGIAGTGIGLNLVKMLVESHGGTISVESEKGVGSTFKVYLPTVMSSPITDQQQVAKVAC